MAHVIRTSDGTQRTAFDAADLIDLIGEKLGDEVRHELEDLLAYTDSAELETENADLRAHHKQVMESLYGLTSQIPGIIQEQEIGRQRLSGLAGKICDSVRRELR